jgi:hypothetical protein
MSASGDMEFRLIYQGPLKAGRGAVDKHRIRCYLHPQLKRLWQQHPLSGSKYLLNPDAPKNSFTALTKVGDRLFASVVHSSIKLNARLDILLLRPEEPGMILNQSGDIDNQLKTLLDALRAPRTAAELPKASAREDEDSILYCLLEDDKLITHLSVSTDRLLVPMKNPSDVIAVIKVETKYNYDATTLRAIYL